MFRNKHNPSHRLYGLEINHHCEDQWSPVETKLNFHVQTDRWVTEHSQHHFSSRNTLDQGPLQLKHTLVSQAICPFLLLSSLDTPFLTTSWRHLCAGCSSYWNLFNNKEEYSYEYPHNTRQESLLPQNAWDLNRQGRWWVGRRGTGKGSDLLGAKPSVNISPPEPYLCGLCTAWVFLTYWTSILRMPLEF